MAPCTLSIAKLGLCDGASRAEKKPSGPARITNLAPRDVICDSFVAVKIVTVIT